MKRFPKIQLCLGLAFMASTAVPGHAQLVFQFERQGANTVVTGSGSATTTANPPYSGIGFNYFHSFPGSDDSLLNRSSLPSGWVSAIPTTKGAYNAPGSTLSVGGGTLFNRLAYTSGGSFAAGLIDSLVFDNSVGSIDIPSSTLVSASGSATFTHPDYLTLFANHAPGTVLQIFPGASISSSVSPLQAPPQAPVPADKRRPFI